MIRIIVADQLVTVYADTAATVDLCGLRPEANGVAELDDVALDNELCTVSTIA